MVPLDWPETYYYLVHQHNPEDQIRVVVIDSYVLFSLCCDPQGLILKTCMFSNGWSTTAYMVSPQ